MVRLIITSLIIFFGVENAWANQTNDLPNKKNDFFELQDLDTKWSREKTISFYKKLGTSLPAQAASSMNLLIDLMQKNKFPVFFPASKRIRDQKSSIVGSYNLRLLSLNPYETIVSQTSEEKLECSIKPQKTNTVSANRRNWVIGCLENKKCPAFSNPSVVIGDDKNNVIHCAWENQFYWLGNGNDEIDDSWGDDIIFAGKGDDSIDAGHGSDIIVFESGWGKDTLNQSCKASDFDIDIVVKSEAREFWKSQGFKYTNFIVFAVGVFPEDLKWEEPYLLVHKKTGDHIQFKNKPCFNFVFYEDGQSDHIESFDWLEFYEKL